VADYVSAINWASQTALRDVIGKTMLSDMLEGRDKISNELQKIIDVRIWRGSFGILSAKAVLNRLASLPHLLRMLVESALHRLKNMLVLPMRCRGLPKGRNRA